MQFSQKSAAVFAALAITGMSLAIPASAADLTGQDVSVDYLSPTTSDVYESDGAQTVNSGGVTFTSLGEINTTVLPSQVVVTFNDDFAGSTFNDVPFSGLHIYQVGGAPISFTNVTIDPATTLAGFDASYLSFDATNIFANFQGLTVAQGDNVTLDLAGANLAPVPEASQFTALAIGAIGLGGLMLRTRRRRAA